MNRNHAKPFLKWVGGKKQLIDEIRQYYPFEIKDIIKYAEPFVGGGAVLFDILNRYNLEQIYISDINKSLITTYKCIKNNVDDLIESLNNIEMSYLSLDDKERKIYFNNKRDRFNCLKLDNNDIRNVEIASLMIFLNKTCFNGLYRENKKGLFNVPIGSYKNPLICDSSNLKCVSNKLKNVSIMYGDYKNCKNFIDNKTFVYFDPPYRPLTNTSSFKSYTNKEFNDEKQIELSKFIYDLDKKGAKILASNSDPKNINENDNFFDNIYSNYNIKRVYANRMINSKGNSRGKIKELLISNF